MRDYNSDDFAKGFFKLTLLLIAVVVWIVVPASFWFYYLPAEEYGAKLVASRYGRGCWCPNRWRTPSRSSWW